MKPVKSVAAYRGFRVDGPEDFARAIRANREEITQIGDPVRCAIDRVDLPLTVRPGDRLSELHVQESSSYERGRVYVGAEDHDPFEIAP